ncbi:MAG: hypothetical protein IZT56_00450 [Bacteroidetes bacterium]|nr:hypothetical protein [Bacteroidota bacterium]
MRSKLVVFALFIFTISIYGQEFVNGTIITKRYDTITDVKIEKFSDAKSLVHIAYINSEGNEVKPDIESIKCYTRGNEKFIRIYYDCDMILVKTITNGSKVNLYERDFNGSKTYYIEKVYDELIKVPSSNGKFSKQISAFLSDNTSLSKDIKNKKLSDIEEIVSLYNKG